MKKLFALVLLSVLALSGQAFAQKTYVNGIDPNYPPFAYIDEKTGEPAGFDVDSLNWIAKTMGITITHKPMAWDGIIPALQAKQIDMIDSGMSITEERKAQVSFSDPYWHVPTVFVTKKDSKLTPEDVLTKKIKLGIQRGTSEAVAIKKEQKAKKKEKTIWDKVWKAVVTAVTGTLATIVGKKVSDTITGKKSKDTSIKDAAGRAAKNATSAAGRQILRDILGNVIK